MKKSSINLVNFERSKNHVTIVRENNCVSSLFLFFNLLKKKSRLIRTNYYRLQINRRKLTRSKETGNLLRWIMDIALNI